MMRPKKRVSTYYNSFRKLWAHRFDPTLPTMFDLPYENPLTDGLPDYYHRIQPQLLSETFVPPNYPHQQMFMAMNLYLYYDLAHTLWYKIPDWFVVLGVPREQTISELRYSYSKIHSSVYPPSPPRTRVGGNSPRVRWGVQE